MFSLSIVLGMYLTVGQGVFTTSDIADIEDLGYIETARIFKDLAKRGYLRPARGGMELTQKAMDICADLSHFGSHVELFAKYNRTVKGE